MTKIIGEVMRFWSKVDTSGDCWLWTGEVNNQGYGRFETWDTNKRSRVFAHRLALILQGVPLGDGDKVLHTCDNPPCCRPDHLRVGTQADNVRDAHEKGRLDLTGLSRAYSNSSRSEAMKKGWVTRRLNEALNPEGIKP